MPYIVMRVDDPVALQYALQMVRPSRKDERWVDGVFEYSRQMTRSRSGQQQSHPVKTFDG